MPRLVLLELIGQHIVLSRQGKQLVPPRPVGRNLGHRTKLLRFGAIAGGLIIHGHNSSAQAL